MYWRSFCFLVVPFYSPIPNSRSVESLETPFFYLILTNEEVVPVFCKLMQKMICAFVCEEVFSIKVQIRS